MNQKEKMNLIQKLKKYGDESEKLYQICVDECPDLLDPTIWIYNQTQMRQSWEIFKADMVMKDNIVSTLMLNCSFSKYMEFMYDTYPVGFGDEIKNCYENDLVCDGAEIFHKLTKV